MINPRPDEFDTNDARLEALSTQQMISQDCVIIAVPGTILQKSIGGLNIRRIVVRKIPKKISKMRGCQVRLSLEFFQPKLIRGLQRTGAKLRARRLRSRPLG